MIIKYMVRSYGNVVYRCECEKETESTVWVKEMKVIGEDPTRFVINSVYERATPLRKRVNSHRFFETREESVKYLRDRVSRSISHYEAALEGVRQDLIRFDEKVKLFPSE
jgi:hypothetical protein